MTIRKQQTFRSRAASRRAAALALGLAVTVAGCENALEVELPGQITEEGTFIPEQADVLVASAIADIECGLADFAAFNAAGAEDAATKSTGWWGTAFQYDPDPTTTDCNSSNTSLGWFTPIHKGRWMAEQTYDRLTGEWAGQVTKSEELAATAAIYAGISYTFFGEFFCESTFNTGPLQSWEQALASGEEWFTKALTHIERAGGDFAISGGVTTSAKQMAHLLRARNRLAQDDLAGAKADASIVTRGFNAWITREDGGERTRWNRVYSSHVGSNGWIPIVGPIDFWTGPPNPFTGEPYPEVIPFTGYWNLGVLPNGRAVTDDEYPITTTAFESAVPDPRVVVVNSGNQRGGPRQYPIFVAHKYQSNADDMPLAKWEEAWLILAQVAAEESNGAEAISRVNDIRDAHGLPQVTYLAPTDTENVVDMVIEEIRRTHFLEGGRYLSAKLRYKLWFPRGVGSDAWGQGYQTGVRFVMPDNEFDLNPNIDESQKGSMCPAHMSPV